MTQDDEEPSAGPGVCPYITGTTTRYCTLTPFTLTDAEREAVKWAAEHLDNCGWSSATLRGLLERFP